MSEDKNIEIENILSLAIAKAKIVGHFQYGHNLLQSTVQIDEIFSMLDTIISEVITAIGDVIPDINLAPYKDGYVDSTRANLCWIKLKDNYYGLILNTHKGIKYREFDDEDIQRLLLSGQVSSWYLISKIQNLSYLLSTDNIEDATTVTTYFKKLIVDIVERFLYEHEHDKEYHPVGKVNLDELDSIFSSLQIQNTSNLVSASAIEEENRSGAIWSSSLIDTPKHVICWQSAANISLKLFGNDTDIKNVISSSYLNENSDVEVFLKETFEKYKGINKLPNVFCFISREKFTYPYTNLNYIIECQLRGYIEVKYTNGTIEQIYPDTQPIVIQKSKNQFAIMTVITLNNDLNRKVEEVIIDNTTNTLPNLYLMCNFTGIIEDKHQE